MYRLPVIVTILILLGGAPGPGWADAAPVWDDVNAIFSKLCVNCHSGNGAGKGLRLDSYAQALKGSARGPVLISGDPASSELIRRLRGESAPRMPFLGRPLPDEQIALIARWIGAGMPEH